MESLAEICAKYETTDKNTVHSYIDNYYEAAFAPYRDKEIVLFEVGVSQGGSMRMYHEYFSNATIYGIDNYEWNTLLRQFVDSNENLNYIIADAYDPHVAKNMIEEYDIFIDDGPHTFSSWLSSITLYLPRVKPGGLFVIEDLKDWAVDKVVEAIPTEYEEYTTVFDLRHFKDRDDDIIIEIKVPEGV
jgi:hypothetical protein